jgi:1-deoxy-D-xylulose-5-phosphate reductoisomerase
MGNPDMRTPIAHALAYPDRIESGVAPLDFFNTPSFEFQAVDYEKYPNLKLAIQACKNGQGACTALNAANEVAVAAFLDEQIKFTDIYKINETSVKKFVSEQVSNINEVISLDTRAREFALSIVENFSTSQLKEQN